MELLVILGIVILVAAVAGYRWLTGRRSDGPEPPDKEGNLR